MSDTHPDRPVLILGGTGEARELAGALSEHNIACVSSLAGRVRDPRLPVGEVRVGGFGGVAGLSEWLQARHCPAVVDATHPFASGITRNAVTACAAVGVPLLRLRRPPWQPDGGDRWSRVPDIGAAAHALRGRSARVLLTTGRQDVDAFADNTAAWFLIRVVDPPTGALPARHRVLRSRGPYTVAGETSLLRENAIDILVTKNSGGDLTRAKLVAARAERVEVVMVDRPPEPPGLPAVEDVPAALAWVVSAVSGCQ